MSLEVHFSAKTVEHATPQDLYDELDGEFGFTVDVCATAENAKCDRFYTKADDGLKQSWAHEVVFCNPPYGRQIKHWVQKAVYESQYNGATVVCLLPARTDTAWFHDCVLAHSADIKFIRGRLKFGGAKSSAPFPSCVVVFCPPAATEEQPPVLN